MFSSKNDDDKIGQDRILMVVTEHTERKRNINDDNVYRFYIQFDGTTLQQNIKW